MLEFLRNAIVRPLVVRWLSRSSRSWQSLPVPSGAPEVVAPGPDPDRILLIGSGIAIGYGMASHEDALGGQLARAVSQLTGRGAHVDVVASNRIPLDVYRDTLTTRRLRELDALVCTPGTVESLLLLPGHAWRREVNAALDHIAAHAPASLMVYVVAVPPLSRIVSLPPLLSLLARFSRASLNRQLRRACGQRSSTVFLPFEPTELAGRTGTGRTYRAWADLIAPRVAAGLQAHAHALRP